MSYDVPPGSVPGPPAGPPPPAPSGRRFRPRRNGALLPTIIIVGVIIVAFLIFAQVYTDWLWYDSIDYGNVFATRIRTQVVLFLFFGLLLGGFAVLNLWIAYRFRPAFRGLSPEQQSLERYRISLDPYRRWIIVGLGLVVGFMAGSSAMTQWQEWLLFRNSVPFGETDPQFGIDLSFYTFELPFWRFLVSVGFAAVILSLVLAAVVHYLYGGIRLQTDGDRLTVAARVHLSVLLGAFVLLKAAAYYLDRYELMLTDHEKFTGASYTDVHAVLPAKNVLIVIALICALLFFANIWRRGWELPALALGLLVFSAVVIGGIYPAVIQQLRVKPSEPVREGPYIQRNIDATRDAYDFDDSERVDYIPSAPVDDATEQSATSEAANARLVDPALMSDTFRRPQQIRAFYDFPNPLDVDRFQLNPSDPDDPRTNVVLAVREIDYAGITVSDRNWANLHAVYTHGYGVVASYANQIASNGQPEFVLRNIALDGDIDISQPRIYFGEGTTEYSIVGKGPGEPDRELDYPDDSQPGDQASTTYEGAAGVGVGSFFRKALFAVKFGDTNLLLSDLVNVNSKILWDRTPRERVAKAAPWLTLDGDPYPTVVDGRVMWIIDGYTTSAGYPYAWRSDFGSATADALTQSQRSSVVAQQRDRVNYIRNSVKATVDAYDGTVTLYEWDEQDPVLKAWEKAFPDTVTPKAEIPEDLLVHFRYPEDLFKVQRLALARYHVTEARAFYTGEDFWQVPNDPTSGDTASAAQPPYYLSVRTSKDAPASYSLTTAYQPRDRTTLASFVSVESDPTNPNYGKITILQLPSESSVAGPSQVQNQFEADDDVSETIRLLSGGGTIEFGNLMTLPMPDTNGLLYVEPLYVRAEGGFPILQRVIVGYGDRVGIAPTLDLAIQDAFRSAPGSLPTEPTPTPTPDPSDPGDPSETPTPTPSGSLDPLTQAIADADRAYTESQAALARGDWTAYGEAQDRLKEALDRAAELQGLSGG